MSRQIRIPFIAPMVQAIAADLKTETRRLGDKPVIEPGDTLLVCEAAWYWCDLDIEGTTPKGRPKRHYRPVGNVVRYCLDEKKPTAPYDDNPERCWRWKPPRFMPAWAVRHRCMVDGVRREPLQAITEAGAKAEGVQPVSYLGCGPASDCYRDGFLILWDTIHGADAPSSSNPDVRVISFHRIKP